MSGSVNYSLANSDQIIHDMGRRFEEVRLSKNISQRDLAKLAGISVRTVTRLEAGSTATFDTVVRVMKALRLDSNLIGLLPDTSIRPMERIQRSGSERKRASAHVAVVDKKPFKWGDQLD